MNSRDQLKLLIDQVPDSRLEMVKGLLEFHVNPPPPDPKIERMQQRSREYRNLVEQRFGATREPGTIGGGAGCGGFIGAHDDTPFGHQSFHYWDGDAIVYQVLQFYEAQEFEFMQRLSLSDDRKKLVCRLELSSGARTVNHEDEFPVNSD